jgi:hypothetical protein
MALISANIEAGIGRVNERGWPEDAHKAFDYLEHDLSLSRQQHYTDILLSRFYRQRANCIARRSSVPDTERGTQVGVYAQKARDCGGLLADVHMEWAVADSLLAVGDPSSNRDASTRRAIEIIDRWFQWFEVHSAFESRQGKPNHDYIGSIHFAGLLPEMGMVFQLPMVATRRGASDRLEKISAALAIRREHNYRTVTNVGWTKVRAKTADSQFQLFIERQLMLSRSQRDQIISLVNTLRAVLHRRLRNTPNRSTGGPDSA